jgi:hypothetical protein
MTPEERAQLVREMTIAAMKAQGGYRSTEPTEGALAAMFASLAVVEARYTLTRIDPRVAVLEKQFRLFAVAYADGSVVEELITCWAKRAATSLDALEGK